jgi:hypothetical protein
MDAVDGKPVSTSVLGYTEIWLALLAKERTGGLKSEQRR